MTTERLGELLGWALIGLTAGGVTGDAVWRRRTDATVYPVRIRWEQCTGCGRQYAYPHLCRKHMLCGFCHEEIEPTDD